jgi:hypothetical protein
MPPQTPPAAQTFELAPPHVQAIRFDGTNAAAIGQLVNHGKTPEVHTEGANRYLSFTRILDLGGQAEMRINVGEWATVDARGQLNVLPGTADHPDGWRPVP